MLDSARTTSPADRHPTIRSPSAPTELRPDTGEGASGRLGRLETSPAVRQSMPFSISEQPRDDFLGLLGEHLLLLVQVGLPGGVVPDLDPCPRSDHCAVP